MTLKQAMMSLEGMSPNVTFLMAFPVMSVVKNASGVMTSCGDGPKKYTYCCIMHGSYVKM